MESMSKKVTTDEERFALAAKLDKELDEFIDGLEKRPYTDGWPEDRWQEEMEKHPFFMKSASGAGDELSPLMEGLQQLKYDPNENTPKELANAYKEDGNFNFKHKNYRLAIIAYTEGLKVKCEDFEVEATLLNNRSAANYFLKNYRSALKDSEWALKYKPDYEKSLVRAANCSFKVKLYEKAVDFCDTILKKNPDNCEIKHLRHNCIRAKKEHDRDLRKLQKKENDQKTKEQEIIECILKSGIRIDGKKFENLQPQVAELADHAVHLYDDKLVWPVIFTYPEYRVMDFVQEFVEDDSFCIQIDRLLQTPPSWDAECKYRTDTINIYFEDCNNHLNLVSVGKTLKEVLVDGQCIVKAGTPTFIILVKGSSAERHFIKKYKM
ncbi:hypothetical protein FQA39_LY10063 [Lamprigera yunnana]|nr:hypothetical protein FQA39_LY10063 [Lamprigera yunnana]